jgi:hypothetical protein
MSRSSVHKPNPRKERTLALNIAREPGRERFLVPLNVDGLAPIELDWLTSDITFIPFKDSWAAGVSQLLRLLHRENCPKGTADGRGVVSRLMAINECVVATSEDLTTNITRFTQIPPVVTSYRVTPKLIFGSRSFQDASRDWACYSVSPSQVLAFHPPGEGLKTWLRAEIDREYEWRGFNDVKGIDTYNVVVCLLRRCVETRLRELGFSWSASAEGLVFPGPNGQNIPVVLPDGSRTTVQHSGERTFFRIGQPKARYRYRLAVCPRVETDTIADYGIRWRLGFEFTDTHGVPLHASMNQSRRKFLARSWFNRHWLLRLLAAIQFCADKDGLLRVGHTGPQQLILDCHPITFSVACGIDEAKLAELQETSDDVPLEDDELMGSYDDIAD